MSAAESDALVAALARATVERAAPEELPLFSATSEAYFTDPKALERSGGKDEMLGFGVDAAVVLLTPIALTVAKDVIGFLGEQLRARAREQGEGAIDRLIARFVKSDDGAAEARGRARPHRRAAGAGARARDREGPRAEALGRAGDAARGLPRREPCDGMSAAAAEPERRPRLNPFAFPSDTAFRFGLLVAAVFGANLYTWQWIASTSRSPAEHLSGTQECLALSAGTSPSLEQITSASSAFSECVSQLYRYQVWWMLGGTAALLLAAAAIMLAAPVWITRRRKLRPLTSADAPAVVEEVAELAREQDLDPPRLYLEPARRVGRRPRLRTPGSLQHRDRRRARRQARGRPAGVQGRRPARARAHPEPRRRDHVLHDCRLVRVPARRRAPLPRHPARRPRHAHECDRAAGRARAPRLPDPERGAAVARGLCRPARLGAGRPRRRPPPGTREPAPTQGRPPQPPAKRPPGTAPPTGRARRHAPTLPTGGRRRLRGGFDRDDCVRQRGSVALELRQRPLRPALPGRTRARPARGRGRRRRDLAGGLRSPRRGPRARVALGRRARLRRRVRTRARVRARPDRHRHGRDNPPP